MTKAHISLLLTVLLAVGITASEARAESCPVASKKSIAIIATRNTASPNGPEIRVSADADLNVQLVATNGTDIDLSSVLIRYSVFNITKKVAERIGGIAPSMRLSGEILPVGKHKISIQVRDSVGRNARLKLTLQVSKHGQPKSCSERVAAGSGETNPTSANT